ncbi:MAG: cytochrome c [Acidobacteria bacterium]|nr:cytochrome c [Acidobacteriota bacterium]
MRFAVLLLAGSCLPVWAHDPITTKITFSREISRLFLARCLGCHKEGGKAPMSLVKYEEARPWAKAIKEEVHERRMPPWGAVKGFGEFAHDMGLSQEEISTIADWVEGGAPEGDPKYYPERPLPDPPPMVKPKGSALTVNGSLTLKSAARLVAVAPRPKADLSYARVIVEQPDGLVEPLVWLKDYKAKWGFAYELRRPLDLAAGSVIRVEGRAPFVIYTQPAGRRGP